MLKKLLFVISLILLVACSSSTNEDYGTAVIVSNHNHKVVGKKIIPVNLVEKNLSLKKSILFVTTRKSDDPNKNKSTINYSIKYTTPELAKDQSKEKQASVNSYSVVVLNSDQIEDKLETVILQQKANEVKEEAKLKADKKNKKNKKNKKKDKKAVAPEPEPVIEKAPLTMLDIKEDSNHNCSKKICHVSQNISFDIDTKLLEDAQKEGFVFMLKPKDGDAYLETKIPANYLKALFSSEK
ncbi:MAG: hypothetical protein KAH18_00035 [Psychromonas sp.]|nr:hypothetical protein [Psychromonas sp.]